MCQTKNNNINQIIKNNSTCIYPLILPGEKKILLSPCLPYHNLQEKDDLLRRGSQVLPEPDHPEDMKYVPLCDPVYGLL